MELYYTPTSPYSRKARIVAREHGVELEEILVSPLDDPPDFHAIAPLGKVPVLVTDSGRSVVDSRVICRYLTAEHTGPISDGTDFDGDLIDAADEAFADGILDCTLAVVMERRRPESQRSQAWLDRHLGKIQRALDRLESALPRTELSFGTVATLVALEYISFRVPDLAWEGTRPGLVAWRDRWRQRASIEATAFPTA